MSRRIKRTLSRDDRSGKTRRAPRKFRDNERVQAARPPGHRPSGKPPRVFEKRRDEQPKNLSPTAAEPAKAKAELLPTKVQPGVVTGDEDNMRVDRCLGARFA